VASESTSTSRETPPEKALDERRSTLYGTLPLALLTGALFLGAFVAYREYSSIGPGIFPLWGLLVVLGFVASIGTVLSWFFATDEPVPAGRTPSAAAVQPVNPPVPSRADFGRPPPDVRAPRGRAGPVGVVAGVQPPVSPAAEPWDEDVLPPPIVRGPRPILTTPEDPGDIAHALEELEDIQRELTTRGAPAPSTRVEAIARA
jgi:hypothetical protein